ncbi:MAG: hypothetical protein EA378_00935 [Phycisphaerales bacterium]|nr:MAG: hypothetical protein EA378_00935 [Phycisphaerales bacterium]
MKIRGRTLVIWFVVLFTFAGGTAVWLRYAGGLQRLQLMTTGMDDWVGRQIVNIANAYLVPQIAFERLEYQAPATVVLTGVTFTAPDGTRVFDVGSLTVELAETPRIGRPIAIASLIIQDGEVNLIQNEDGDGFRGLQPLVKGQTERERAADTPGTNLSDVLELRQVRIINGGLRLDMGQGEPMVLRELELALDIRPLESVAPSEREPDGTAAGDERPRPSGPGWYEMALDTGRPPNAVIKADARLNIDTFEVDLASSTITLDVTEQSIEALPPQIQSILRQYQASGALRIEATGRVPLRDLNAGSAKTTVTLNDFNVTQGEFRLPITRLSTEATLDGGVVNIASGVIRMLGGSVAFRGSLPLEPGGRAQIDWTANRLELENLLAARTPGGGASPETPGTPVERDAGAESPIASAAPSAGNTDAQPPPDGSGTRSATPATRSRLAGRLSGEGVASFEPNEVFASIGGDGAIEVSDGRLLMIPGLTQLAQVMNVGQRLTGDTSRNHRLSARFELTPEGIRVNESALVTNALAARATGMISYKAVLDLSANAGPMERVQAALGPIGDVFGNITDRLVTYRIRGPMGDPSVSVAAGRGDQHRPEQDRQRAEREAQRARSADPAPETEPEPAPEPPPEPSPEPPPGGRR